MNLPITTYLISLVYIALSLLIFLRTRDSDLQPMRWYVMSRCVEWVTEGIVAWFGTPVQYFYVYWIWQIINLTLFTALAGYCCCLAIPRLRFKLMYIPAVATFLAGIFIPFQYPALLYWNMTTVITGLVLVITGLCTTVGVQYRKFAAGLVVTASLFVGVAVWTLFGYRPQAWLLMSLCGLCCLLASLRGLPVLSDSFQPLQSSQKGIA